MTNEKVGWAEDEAALICEEGWAEPNIQCDESVDYYTISGTITDRQGGALQGAQIMLGLLGASSDIKGQYTIHNVPAGTSGDLICTLSEYSFDPVSIAITNIHINMPFQDFEGTHMV